MAPIPESPKIYHITHVDNLQGILTYPPAFRQGILVTGSATALEIMAWELQGLCRSLPAGGSSAR